MYKIDHPKHQTCPNVGANIIINTCEYSLNNKLYTLKNALFVHILSVHDDL